MARIQIKIIFLLKRLTTAERNVFLKHPLYRPSVRLLMINFYVLLGIADVRDNSPQVLSPCTESKKSWTMAGRF